MAATNIHFLFVTVTILLLAAAQGGASLPVEKRSLNDLFSHLFGPSSKSTTPGEEVTSAPPNVTAPPSSAEIDSVVDRMAGSDNNTEDRESIKEELAAIVDEAKKLNESSELQIVKMHPNKNGSFDIEKSDAHVNPNGTIQVSSHHETKTKEDIESETVEQMASEITSDLKIVDKELAMTLKIFMKAFKKTPLNERQKYAESIMEIEKIAKRLEKFGEKIIRVEEHPEEASNSGEAGDHGGEEEGSKEGSSSKEGSKEGSKQGSKKGSKEGSNEGSKETKEGKSQSTEEIAV